MCPKHADTHGPFQLFSLGFVENCVMQLERFTLLVQTEFQQFVLTGAWHLPSFLLGLMSPIQLFPSNQLAALRNAHFPQSIEFPKDKFKSWPIFFLVEWNKILDASVYESKMGCKLLIFKSKYNLSVSLPVTNNLQAVSKSYNMELFNWPFRFQTDVYTSVIHNGSLFGKLTNYSFFFQSSLTGCSALFSQSLSYLPWHTDTQSTKRVEKVCRLIAQCSQTVNQQRCLKPYSYL